jgi:hypothetical protein
MEKNSVLHSKRGNGVDSPKPDGVGRNRNRDARISKGDATEDRHLRPAHNGLFQDKSKDEEGCHSPRALIQGEY